MLRGSSRHDGIPNKQSARERDRDRLRERQRQERQQMLPNDEKDINVGAQDLFHAPVKVKPSVEDSTTAQIANTLGSFDTVRHLILDTSQRRLGNLIGVDQGSLPGTPVAPRNPSQSLISGHTTTAPEQGSGGKAPYFHPQLITGGQSNTGEQGSKNHHRNLYSSSSSTTSSTNSSSTAPTNNSGGGLVGTHNNLSLNSSSSDFNFPAPASNYRVSGSNSHQKGLVSHNSQSSLHHSNSNSSQSSASNHNHNSAHLNAVSATASSQSSSASGTAGNQHNSSTSSAPNSNSSSGGGSSGSLNSGYPSSAINSNNSNSNQVRQTASSFNNSNGSSGVQTSVTDANSEGLLNVSSAKTVVGNTLLTKELHESASGAPDDKNSRHASSNRKPALERADSQLEIESMLKEMMDITAPLTAIQTPVKETSTKKFIQRRSSKSEEKIVQSIRDSGMADVPSPVQRMDSSGDSSSSYESETSDSDSEESSSGSQTGGEKIDTAIPKITPNTNSPTRWNLGSFIRKNDYRGTPADANTTTTIGGSKSPKETKPNAHQVNAINSETSPGDAPIKTEPVVSSTSLFNKSQSLSPLDTPTAPALSTRKITRSTAEIKTETSYVPPKPPPTTGTTKQASNLISNPVSKSLSSSSSEDESEKPPKPIEIPPTTRSVATPVVEEKSGSAAGAGKRKRKRSSSSVERTTTQKTVITEEVSPEGNGAKNKKNVQDRKKNNTIRKLFMFNKKVDSPTRSDGGELGKSPSSGPPNTNGNGPSNSSATAASNITTGSGSGGSSSSTAVPSVPGGPSGSSSSSNRVQAKDSGKKSKESAAVSNNVHNGELENSATLGASVTEPITVSKKRDDSGTKEKDSTSSRTSHGKKNQKSVSSVPGSSAGKASVPIVAPLLPPPPPPAAKTKEDLLTKPDKILAMSSSLVVKINLSKLKRKPSIMPPPPPLAPLPVAKIEKDSTDKGGKTIKEPPAATSNNADLLLKRVHHNSSRVGSSSDHAKDAKETTIAAHNNPPPGRIPPDGSLCSDIDCRGKRRSKSKKVKSSSPKKPKPKHEPDSHSKIEEDPACGEVSSNVLGYASCDSVLVSTTRTPPVECDVVQAPDSSLNPPHLPSPVVPPQPVYYSYFEKNDSLEDYYSRRDQDSYLEEAKRLKHKADGERVSTTQASVYLEAGLYFILTGISMERDRQVGSTAAFTMYKDTLVLIRYIGSRFRNRNAEYSNPMEAKIIVLSMRCQSMLSLKLYKIKMRETRDMVQLLQDHFQRHPTEIAPVAISPQLSTPSPHSPTSSPAASSSLHPSPHHHNQIMTSIPRSVYSNMQKTCNSTMNLISAHELWEAADHLVEKYHIEDFFITLDRQFGPLTLHNSLVDLVRYVKHALSVLKTAELS